MTTEEYIEYISEDIAIEGLKDILTSPEFANRLVRGAGSVMIDILDAIAANIIVLTNNLRGYIVHKEIAKVMDLVISKFDKMIDDCTYNYDKLIQGFGQNDVEKGIKIFEAKSLTQKTATRIAISEALKAIDDAHREYKCDARNWHQDLTGKLFTNKDSVNNYTDTVKLQEKMLRLQRKIINLGKRIKLGLSRINVLEKYGISKEYAEELLSTNKAEIAKMGSVLINSFSMIYVRPLDDGVASSKKLKRENRKVEEWDEISIACSMNDPKHPQYIPNHNRILNNATQMLDAVD